MASATPSPAGMTPCLPVHTLYATLKRRSRGGAGRAALAPVAAGPARCTGAPSVPEPVPPLPTSTARPRTSATTRSTVTPDAPVAADVTTRGMMEPPKAHLRPQRVCSRRHTRPARLVMSKFERSQSTACSRCTPVGPRWQQPRNGKSPAPSPSTAHLRPLPARGNRPSVPVTTAPELRRV